MLRGNEKGFRGLITFRRCRSYSFWHECTCISRYGRKRTNKRVPKCRCRQPSMIHHPTRKFYQLFSSNCRKNKSYFSLYPRWHWWFGLKVHSWSRLLFDSDSKETFFLHCHQVLGWTCSCSEARFYQRQRLRLQIQGWRFCFPTIIAVVSLLDYGEPIAWYAEGLVHLLGNVVETSCGITSIECAGWVDEVDEVSDLGLSCIGTCLILEAKIVALYFWDDNGKDSVLGKAKKEQNAHNWNVIIVISLMVQIILDNHVW